MRAWVYRLYGPGEGSVELRWIGDTRVGIGALPTPAGLPRLAAQGVTDVVNCRTRLQTWLSKDLAAERDLFGAAHVVAAPMWDLGRRQPARRWTAAAQFAARALARDRDARVFIHCQHGRHRSVMVGYAVLRLLGHPPDRAERLLEEHHEQAELLPRYRESVERWLRR
jgi:protein-tyrosine phosphatase